MKACHTTEHENQKKRKPAQLGIKKPKRLLKRKHELKSHSIVTYAMKWNKCKRERAAGKWKVVTRFLERHHIPRASENGATRNNNTCEPRRKLPESAAHRPYCRVVNLKFLLELDHSSSSHRDRPRARAFMRTRVAPQSVGDCVCLLRTPAMFVTTASFASNGGIATFKSTRGPPGGVLQAHATMLHLAIPP